MTSALAPLLLVAFAVYVVVFCVRDVREHPDTRLMSAQAWVVACVLGTLLGCAAYMIVGRSETR
ncbi:PLDc N-terminal domain-containing protein [Streptacidiphilus sp. N1-12]|uniref:PLDc N-terminal domain-containing protein n=2 Tax=Streptacidiphilus alkalitolerans TaxID=3342712 RepID=A0ABV6WDD4_9ACTN